MKTQHPLTYHHISLFGRTVRLYCSFIMVRTVGLVKSFLMSWCFYFFIFIQVILSEGRIELRISRACINTLNHLSYKSCFFIFIIFHFELLSWYYAKSFSPTMFLYKSLTTLKIIKVLIMSLTIPCFELKLSVELAWQSSLHFLH